MHDPERMEQTGVARRRPKLARTEAPSAAPFLATQMGNRAFTQHVVGRSPSTAASSPVLRSACGPSCGCDSCGQEDDEKDDDKDAEHEHLAPVSGMAKDESGCSSVAGTEDEMEEEEQKDTPVSRQASPLVVQRSSPILVQRSGVSARGFPPDKRRQLLIAVEKAARTVANCKSLGRGRRLSMAAMIRDGVRYDYINKDSAPCGWTFPMAWYVEIGKKAFDHKRCCDLESTIAHEVAHTVWYTEGRARKLECNCFGCCAG